jgi:hypothetical protein
MVTLLVRIEKKEKKQENESIMATIDVKSSIILDSS